jgi:hypothetical protein
MNYLIIAIFAAVFGFGATALAADPAASEKRPGTSEGKTLGLDPQSKGDAQAETRQSDCSRMQGLQARSQPQRSEVQQPSAMAGQPQSQRSQDPSQPPQSQQPAAGSEPSGGSQAVVGEFVKMEGDNYVVKDASGKTLCILSTYATFIDGTFVPGDTIEARIAADGSAARIRRVLDTRVAGSRDTQDSPTGSDSKAQETPAQGTSGQMERTSDTRTEKDLAEGRQSAPTVKGELLQIQGEFYTVKDASGNEIRLHVNNDTKMDSAFKVGDKIEAERTSSGHALSMKKTTEPGARKERP